jgi:hypothetical protein
MYSDKRIAHGTDIFSSGHLHKEEIVCRDFHRFRT